MKVTFPTTERIEGKYTNVVMSYCDAEKMVTRCLNNDELELLNDPLREDCTLEYFSLKFAEECNPKVETIKETTPDIMLEQDRHSGDITVVKDEK